VEQELLTLPEHLSLPQIFSGVHVAQSFFFLVVLFRSLFVLFVPFLAHLTKGHVSFCHQVSFVRRLSLAFHILIFSSETTEPN
jgi:hypothetical protein